MTNNQVNKVAQKITSEVRFIEQVTLKPFSARPVWRGAKINNITNEEAFVSARSLMPEFAVAFYVKDEQTACYHPMSDNDAWLAFKLVFGPDETNYRSIGRAA